MPKSKISKPELVDKSELAESIKFRLKKAAEKKEMSVNDVANELAKRLGDGKCKKNFVSEAFQGEFRLNQLRNFNENYRIIADILGINNKNKLCNDIRMCLGLPVDPKYIASLKRKNNRPVRYAELESSLDELRKRLASLEINNVGKDAEIKPTKPKPKRRVLADISNGRIANIAELLSAITKHRDYDALDPKVKLFVLGLLQMERSDQPADIIQANLLMILQVMSNTLKAE